MSQSLFDATCALGTVTRSYAEGVSVVKNVRIPMRDGVRLAADLYIPNALHDPQPVVMEYIPYRKDDVALGSRFYTDLVTGNYIVARVDVRGTGGSEGTTEDEYTLTEQLDGVDTVEWLAQQVFCDGHVNMMGISYGGFTAVQIAARRPPHLTSIVPMFFTDDRYTDDCHYKGGLLRNYYDLAYYGTAMVAFNALPPDPEASGDDWASLWDQHLRGNEPYILQWYRHQTDGEYWRQGSVRDVAHQIRCPVFMVGGWRDGYTNPPLRLFEALTVPKRLLVGPWNHDLPDVAVPGPRIDYMAEVVPWLDHWCRGSALPADPPVTVYMQRFQDPDADRLDTDGEWRGERSWPPEGCGSMELYFSDGGRLVDSPEGRGTDTYSYRPTVGVAGGLWSGGLPFGLPGDQRIDEAYSLTYTSSPLDADLAILGRPVVYLHVSSTAPVMGYVVSLSEVSADGRSHLVAKGAINGTRRRSLRDPEAISPGEEMELRIDIDATGWVFSAGNRIRVAVASADWPNLWPTPDAGDNTVFRGEGSPSRLVLPTVPEGGSARLEPFLPSTAVIERHKMNASPPNWTVTRDLFDEAMTYQISHRTTDRVDGETVVNRLHQFSAECNPDEPERSSSRGRHTTEIVRSDERLESTAQVSVESSRTEFHITIDLEVRVNDALHFSRSWTESVMRELL